ARRLPGGSVFAGVFPALPAGDYTLLGTGEWHPCNVTIVEGGVTEVHWYSQVKGRGGRAVAIVPACAASPSSLSLPSSPSLPPVATSGSSSRRGPRRCGTATPSSPVSRR